MSRLDEAVRRLRSGEPAVLFDEDRDGRAVLFAPADAASPALLRLMLHEGQGAPALWFDAAFADTLNLPGRQGETAPTGFGSDAAERGSALLKAMLSGGGEAADVERIGMTCGRVARHGVLERPGEAEAAVDAIRSTGRLPAALVASLRLDGGLLAGRDAARAWAVGHGLPVFSIQDVVADRLLGETIVEAVASARLPTLHAALPLEVRAYRSLIDGGEHLAMIHTPLGADPLVRIHSECLTGDALGSLRCDCGDQLRQSLRLIAEHPQGGVVVYLRGQEGRGIGLVNKIRAYALQDLGLDTVEANLELGFPADLRSYGVAVQILRGLGIGRLKLLTNNPAKSAALERYGIRVVERVALRVGANRHNAGYLDTKRLKMGHDFAAPVAALMSDPA